jgi:hypothetical protein
MMTETNISVRDSDYGVSGYFDEAKLRSVVGVRRVAPTTSDRNFFHTQKRHQNQTMISDGIFIKTNVYNSIDLGSERSWNPSVNIDKSRFSSIMKSDDNLCGFLFTPRKSHDFSPRSFVLIVKKSSPQSTAILSTEKTEYAYHFNGWRNLSCLKLFHLNADSSIQCDFRFDLNGTTINDSPLNKQSFHTTSTDAII